MQVASEKAARQPAGATRRWLFANAVLDERSLTLTVDGKVSALDPKPLEVLLHLLNHAGEVVTKDELLAAVWPGRILSDAGLTSCVARLRAALADDAQSIIKTVHGYGYRLVAPVKVEASTAPPPPRFDFKPGDHPQGHSNWSLVDRLGTGGHGEVWLARHDKTGEPRIFKYALDEEALPSLKREITLSRYLHDTLGDDAPYVRILDWNLDVRPFCIQAEYTQGGNLVTWAVRQGGIKSVPFTTRLELAIRIAEALAAAHSVGVLHKDLKPSNVLIDATDAALPRIRLSDFGSGGVLEPGKLDAMGITRMGLTMTQGMSATSGTPIYLAPELIAEQPATMQTDIYAMGVLLYQLVVGDLKRPLAPGWEDDVEDALLREDIAAAAAGKPERRLTDAAALAERLRTLEKRRAERAASLAPAPARILPRAVLASLLAVSVVAVVTVFVLWPGSAPKAPTGPSIAVLPFVNAGGDPAQEYFSDGLSDELATALQRVAGLQVAPRSSAFPYKGRKTAVSQIGQELKVGTVLSGTLLRLEEKVRLSVQLRAVAGGEILWSQAYESPTQDIFGVLEQIAQAVVQTLALDVPGDGALVQQGTKNIAAYEAYLRAMPSAGSVTDNAQHIGLLEQAVALDPGFAKAWSWLGTAYLVRIHFIAPGDLAALRRGFAATERASSLDPGLFEARLTRAGLLFTPANGFAAEQAFKEVKHVLALGSQAPVARTLGMSGGAPRAWGQIGVIYWHWGLLDENEKLARWGITVEPGNPIIQEGLGTALLFNGKYEEALEWLEKTPRTLIAPLFWYWKTTWALLELGRKPEAAARIDEYFRTNEDSAGIVTSMKAVLAALEGRASEVDAIVRELRKIDRRFGHFHHTAYNVGMAYALLDRRQDALEWLDWSAKHGFPCHELFKSEPFLANLRDEPKFKNLVEYTRQQADKIRALGLPAPDSAGLPVADANRAEARALYLKAKPLVGNPMTSGMDEVIAMLEKSVALDPQAADAWASLASAYGGRLYFFAPADGTLLKKGFAAAERALSLDANRGEAHAARGLLLWSPANGFVDDQAAKEYTRALALDPTLTGGAVTLATIYQHNGLFAEGRAVIDRSLAIDPDHEAARFIRAAQPIWEGDFAEGLRQLVEVRANFFPILVGWHRAWGLFELGRKDEAGAFVDDFLAHKDDRGGLLVSMKAVFAAAAGRSTEAERIIHDISAMDRRFGHFHHTAYNVASTLALLDRRAEALEWLEWSFKNGFPCAPIAARDGNLANLRNEPKFDELLAYARAHAEKVRLAGLNP
jgi:TolB-like protein/DNA-binding winged helix-turn-helix (wHTH) protein/cytochrome c-type biogenesis protein CcmH/NrfG